MILVTLLITVIIFWATSIIPDYQTSLIFLFTSLIFSLSSKDIIFSGFSSSDRAVAPAKRADPGGLWPLFGAGAAGAGGNALGAVWRARPATRRSFVARRTAAHGLGQNFWFKARIAAAR